MNIQSIEGRQSINVNTKYNIVYARDEKKMLGIYKDKAYIKVTYSDKDKVDIENQIIVYIDVNANMKGEKDKSYITDKS